MDNQSFECGYCQMTFTMKKNKKRHEREIHNKGQTRRNFHCDMCTSRFGRRSDLKKHKRKYHVKTEKMCSEESPEPKRKFVKIPEYSDISSDEMNFDTNNNTSDSTFRNYTINADTENTDGTRTVYFQDINKQDTDNLNDLFNDSNDNKFDNDFLDITDQEFNTMKSDLVITEDVKTVTLTLTKTEQKFLDGSVKVKKESCIGYSENVDKDKLNLKDIVVEVTDHVNDFLGPNNKDIPNTFYTV